MNTRLIAALGGQANLVSFPDDFLYQLDYVRAWNTNIKVVPRAVTVPKTTAQVAAIVRCAVQAGRKVQARCGGHSYGNLGAHALICPIKSPSRVLRLT
jgi:FAD/FMN-containing dehydrogenase